MGTYELSQFFIDQHQRRGYGIMAMELILEKMKEDGKFDKVELCYIEGEVWRKKKFKIYRK
ncbi:MAG: hypothetical protein J5928_03945 [Firmicutes bacterium]|nr:hypothetical protein [Bacillota bacterium]